LHQKSKVLAGKSSTLVILSMCCFSNPFLYSLQNSKISAYLLVNLLVAIKALAYCESTIDTYKKLGHRWGWARKLIDLGDAFVRRNEPSDLESAEEAYQQSLNMFTEMGARGYIKVLEERLGDL
jgi:hypothetical protein